MAQHTHSNRINKLVGNQMGLGPIPAGQLPYWILLSLPALVGWFFFRWDFFTLCFGLVLPCGTFWLLTGQREWKFLEQFHAPRTWTRRRAWCEWRGQAVLPDKGKGQPQRIRQQGRQQKVHPIEDTQSLVCYGQINFRDQECGFYLLRKKRKLTFVFAWEAAGFDPLISEAEAEVVLGNLEKGIQEICRHGHSLTFENRSFAHDQAAQTQLDQLLNQATQPLEQVLIYSQKARIRDLRQQGLRKTQSLRIFYRYTVAASPRSAPVKDWQDRVFLFLADLLADLQGEKAHLDRQRLQKMVNLALTQGFLRADSALNTVMHLGAKPICAQTLWEQDYRELHQQPAPRIPQLLLMTDKGLSLVQHTQEHVLSVLFQPERGQAATIQTAREWVYVPLHKQYVGFMQICQPDSYPTQQGPHLRQLRYLWEAQRRGNDLKVVAQVTLAHGGVNKFNLERHTRNAIQIATRASKDQTVDVGSEHRMHQSIAARQALEDGNYIATIGVGMYLYRKNPTALDKDFVDLADALPTAPAERAFEVAEQFWFQSWPFAPVPFLAKPHDRRDKYLSQHVTGMMPVIVPRKLHQEGIHFLTREGGAPVYLNLFTQAAHLAVFATTRGGKSVLLADVIMQFFLRQIPVVAFDFPKPTDGSSTFSDLVTLLGQLGSSAAYNDTGSCSNNLLELPDFRFETDPKAFQERMHTILNFQEEAILTIVMGDVQDAHLEQQCQSLINQSLGAFHRDPQIRQRYQAAIAAGYGTPDHERTPTLWDYLHFSEQWLQDYMHHHDLTASVGVREAAGYILNQLRGALNSKLGRAIAQPSSFRTDVQLLVFALRGLSSNREAAVAALSGYAALLRRALSSPACAFIIDESPILFEFEAIARIVKQLVANGLKWGCRVIISAQTASKIYRSSVGDDILQNIAYKLVGYITAEAVDSFVEILKYERQIIARYATEGYRPSARELRSNWVLKADGEHIELSYYPSPILLALVANNPDEQAARQRVMAQAADPLQGVTDFAQQYCECLTRGQALATIAPEAQPLGKRSA